MKIWRWDETATNGIGFFFEEPDQDVVDGTQIFEIIRDSDLTDGDRHLATYIVRSLNLILPECPLP